MNLGLDEWITRLTLRCPSDGRWSPTGFEIC